MKKMLKKVVSVLLCLATLITAAPFSDLFATKAEAAVNWGDLGIDFSVNEYIAGIITNTNRNSCAISDDGKSIQSIDLDYYTQPQNVSLSKCYTEPLESDAQFMASVAAWEVLTFSPSDIYNESLNEIGYYQAILFEILNAAVDYNFIPSIVESTNKHVISTVSAINELGIKLDDIVVNGNTQWDLLKADQQHKIIQETAKHMNKLEMRGQDLSNISDIIETATTVIDYVEKTSQLYALTTLTEDIKTVINELSANSSFLDNPEMKTAISEIKNAMVSKFENIGTIGLELVGSGTKLAMDIFLSQMWGECVSAALGSLGAGLLIGQVIGRGLSNILFSTDETIKQFYMMQALADFEKLMCKSVKSLGAKYSSSPNSSSASAFLKSVDLLYNTYMLDFEYSADFAEILHEKGLVNKINLFLSGKSKDLAKINSIVSSMKDTVSMTLGMLTDLDSYRWYLETDYPDVYAVYYGGLSIEDMTNRYIEKVRALTVACPTDVDIYNADNEVVVSVKNNEVKICMPGYFCVVEDDIKYLVISAESPSEVVITGTDEGEMTYSIYEADEHGFKRTIKFKNVELTKGCSFEADLPQNIRQASEKYVLVSDEGKTIKPNFDTQPEINTEITDIIVSEELFDGFSTELIDKVANAMFKFEPVVNITSYNISTDDTVALFSAISKYYPTEYSLLTKSDFKYKIIFSPSLGCITDIRFYYGDDANLEAFEQRNKDLKAEIDKIVAQVKGMDDFEKALYIHDYIVMNSEYDLELLEMLESGGTLSGELYTEKYSEYSILINGTGICGSYALAYRALMTAAGVDCLYLSSQQMNHAWNMVKIDGEWYHVDCCWDDPVPDTYGDARRTYFLRTDEEIMELNHYSWVPGTYKATSTLYSGMPRNYNSKQKYEDGYWYISDYSKVYKSDLYGKSKEELFAAYSSSIDVYNGDVYYSTNSNIYCYDEQSETGILSLKIPESKSDSTVNLINFIAENDSFTYYCTRSDENRKYFNGTAPSQKALYDAVNKVELSANELNLNVFDKTTLTASISSSSETKSLIVEWSSSNPSVATITDNGEVVARKGGTTTITVKVGAKADTCIVNVAANDYAGFCESGAKWEFDVETKTLHISAFEGITSADRIDFAYSEEVETVVFEEGLTIIDGYIFTNVFRFSWSSLKKITIPRSVKLLENPERDLVFLYCENLQEICVDSQNEYYSSVDGVLYNKQLTKLIKYPEAKPDKVYHMPDSVEEINYHGFDEVRFIEEVHLSDKLKSTGTILFCALRLREVYIGSGTEKIDYWFRTNSCYNVEKIVVDENNQYYSSEDGVLFNKDKTEMICYPPCKPEKTYKIPEGVETIGNMAILFNSFLEVLEVPKSVKILEIKHAIYNKILDEYCVNSPMGSMDTYGFPKLREIIVDEANEYYSSKDGVLFSKDKSTLLFYPALKESEIYSVPNEVFYVDPKAFDYCKYLKRLEITENVSEITLNIYNTQESLLHLSEIVVSDNNLNYSSENGILFSKDKTQLICYPPNKSGKDFVIPESVTTLGEGSIKYSLYLKNVTLTPNVSQINDGAFSGTKVKNILILNPDCKIKSLANCTVYGYSGSTAETYADKNNLTFVDIEATPHEHVEFLMEYVEKTEEVDGLIKYSCYCGANERKIVSHHYGTPVITGDCESELIEKTECSVCHHVESVSLGKNKHLLKFVSETFGTCINPGVKIYECTVCGHTEEVLKSAEEGHSYTETVTPPTCTEIGYTTATCEHCGENAMYDFVPMLGHDVTATHTDSDCKKYAQTEYSCSRCDYHETVVDEDGGLGDHKISVSVTEATCTVNGSIDRVCVTCNEIISSETIAAGGHIPGEWKTVTESTTEAAGKKEQRCEVCSELLADEVIPKIPVNVSGIALNEAEVEIVNKSTHQLQAIISPDNADDKTVLWASDNENTVTVNTQGILTAVNLGNATVTATTNDGRFSASCNVTVLPREFTVTWICGYTESVDTIKEGSSITSSVTPTKTGYTFDGWTPAVPDTMPSENLTFVATWKPISYDAVFNADGGKWADGTQSKPVPTDFDSKISAPEAPEKQGYVFSEWSPEVGIMDSVDGKVFTAVWIPASDTKYTVETYTMNTAGEYEKSVQTLSGKTDSTVSAQYVPVDGFTINEEKSVLSGVVAADNSLVLKVYLDRNKYSVITVVDGVSSETTVYYGAAVTEPDAPEKTGYTFDGWTPTVPGTMPAENLTFVATWKPNSYDAVFNADGGKWADGTQSKSVPTDFDSRISAPEAPEKQGYVFSEWSPEVGIMDSVNGKTFTAVWIPASDTKYMVETYTMNTAGEYEKSVQTLSGKTDSTVSAQYVPVDGFTLNEEKSVLSGVVAADNSLVLKVYADRNKYSVITVVDGVSSETKVYYGAAVTEPDAPEKTGYTFTGWQGELPETMPAENVTVTAQWKVNSYTVTWIVNGTTSSEAFEYGAEITAPTSPAKPGYEFIGWDKTIPDTMPANNLSFTAIFRCNSSVSINRNPKAKTINYGETLKLTATKTGDAIIYWYVDGEKAGEGETFYLKFESGTKTVEVKLVDANGNVICGEKDTELSDKEEVTVKSGFFLKLISFFKDLFRMNRTVVQ